MKNDTEHLFICLLIVYTYIFREVSVQIFCPFFKQDFLCCFLVLGFKSTLYILYTSPLR